MPPPAVLNTFATPPPEAEIQEIKLNSAKSIQLFKPTSVMAAEKLRWKHHVSIDKMLDEFFEVVVYNIIASETTPSVFVMETHNQRKFNQFLKNTTKMYEKPPVSKCTFEVLKIGQLVITQFEGEFMYRAEVIGKDEAYKEVRMRLVDCGTEFILKNFDQLRRPTIELMNQEAFGFEVFVDPKVDYLKLGDKIMIKLTRVAGKIKRGE